MENQPPEGVDTPFIHSPDEVEADKENGLVCFLSVERPCGADCTAFTTYPAESKLLSEQQKNCVLIVAMERLGRYSGGFISMIRPLLDDIKRGMQNPPPSPG